MKYVVLNEKNWVLGVPVHCGASLRVCPQERERNQLLESPHPLLSGACTPVVTICSKHGQLTGCPGVTVSSGLNFPSFRSTVNIQVIYTNLPKKKKVCRVLAT